MSHARRISSEWPLETTSREDRPVFCHARVAPTSSLYIIKTQVEYSLQATVFARTVARSCAERHLISRRQIRSLLIIPIYRRLRFEWCRARRD